ncbi:MAG: hypothetical protein AABY07_02710 [Nanoarchaeota archaeon]
MNNYHDKPKPLEPENIFSKDGMLYDFVKKSFRDSIVYVSIISAMFNIFAYNHVRDLLKEGELDKKKIEEIISEMPNERSDNIFKKIGLRIISENTIPGRELAYYITELERDRR